MHEKCGSCGWNGPADQRAHGTNSVSRGHDFCPDCGMENWLSVEPVLVETSVGADEANGLYGERFGVDWIYES